MEEILKQIFGIDVDPNKTVDLPTLEIAFDKKNPDCPDLKKTAIFMAQFLSSSPKDIG